MLTRYPSQKRTSCSWSEYKDQRKNTQRSEENRSKQEEIRLRKPEVLLGITVSYEEISRWKNKMHSKKKVG